MVIDVIVIAVLLLSALIAFLRGFIRETLTILGVTGGLAAAYLGGPLMSPYIRNLLGVHEGEKPQRLLGLIPYPILADILSYGLIFIAVVIVLSIVSHVLAETVRSLGLGSLDRILGVLFGLARGILLLGVLYLPFHLALEPQTKKEWFDGSKSYVYLEQVAQALADYLPQSTIKQLTESAKEVGNSSSDVKDKLQEIDLLKGKEKEGEGAADQKTDSNAPVDSTQPAPGYSDEFRQKMDQLFKGNESQQPATAPAQPAPQQGPAQ